MIAEWKKALEVLERMAELINSGRAIEASELNAGALNALVSVMRTVIDPDLRLRALLPDTTLTPDASAILGIVAMITATAREARTPLEAMQALGIAISSIATSEAMGREGLTARDYALIGASYAEASAERVDRFAASGMTLDDLVSGVES